MKFGKTAILGFCAAAVAAACSTGGSHQAPSGTASNTPASQAGSPGSPDNIGAVGMQLTLPGGEHISTVAYTLKNANNTYTGTYNVNNASTISFVIGSVAADTGYSLTLTATSDDGKVTCSFPAVGDALVSNITVVNRTTTIVNVNMQCVNNQGLDSGSVLVNAVQSNCPDWNTIVVNPENIALTGGGNADGSTVNTTGTPGTSVAFSPTQSIIAVINDAQSAVVVGSGTGPQQSALTFNWTILSQTGSGTGTISSAAGTLDPNGTGQPNGQSATNQTIFTCPAAGTPTQTFTLQLVMTDGPVPDGGSCDANFTTGTVQVQCLNPAPCGGNPLIAGGTPAVGTYCGSVGTTPYVVTGSSVHDTGTPADLCCNPVSCTAPAVAGNFSAVTVGSSASTATCTGTNQNNGLGCCGPLVPCTAAGQLNCVKCQGSTGGICTATEALVVQHDIDKNGVAAAGNSPSTSCYACLQGAGCLDDMPSIGDVNHECGDSVIVHGGTVGTLAQECLNVVSCIFGSDNPATDPLASASTDVGYSTGNCSSTVTATCYCGTAAVAGNCGGTASAANGVCSGAIAAGSGFPVADGTDNLGHFAPDSTYASGMATQVFKCAVNSSCSTCLN